MSTDWFGGMIFRQMVTDVSKGYKYTQSESESKHMSDFTSFLTCVCRRLWFQPKRAYRRGLQEGV
ncbi:hypothetical protein C2E23DRAFT_849191 [Lenzites betulinus]|nr:hypothetical protein C2E23DRAFT_849191 [Lenzites betulinus]